MGLGGKSTAYSVRPYGARERGFDGDLSPQSLPFCHQKLALGSSRECP